MRYAFIILKWEIQKIMSSWKKTMAVFLVPAAVMVFAINLFPKLLNYLTSGSAGNQKIVVVDAPDSFMEFSGKKADLYRYDYITSDDIAGGISEETVYPMVEDGNIVVLFHSSTDDFDSAVREKYRRFYMEGIDVPGGAFVELVYNDEKFLTETKANQYESDVLDAYKSYLDDKFFAAYVGSGTEVFKVDEFNPITFILDNRNTANTQACRVIPGILVILMYYCVYSLSCDMIAMEKNRGFLNKLVMTPASCKMILWGKALATNIMVTGSSFVTFLFLFLSSWINRSNDAGSLLPFGLMLMPDQLLYMLLSIPATVLVLTAFCFLVALELERFEDAVANMQFILLLLLVGFFVQMFYFWDPIFIEYLIPGHNMIVLLKQIILSEVTILQFIAVLAVNVPLGIFLMNRCAKLLEGGEYDRSKKRKQKILF
ncbi:MAG: ABC transporter permease subunit [Clostridiales bacterium]|nr:ABC transporter permease subunit [Clostridiales bacterium]